MTIHSDSQVIRAVNEVHDINARAKRYLELYRQHCNGLAITVPSGDLQVFACKVSGTIDTPRVTFVVTTDLLP